MTSGSVSVSIDIDYWVRSVECAYMYWTRWDGKQSKNDGMNDIKNVG